MVASSPFRPVDERRLDRYFERVLGSRRFEPAAVTDKYDWDIFRLSLESCWDHLGDTTPKHRADGRPFRLAAGFVDLIRPSAFATERGGTHLIGVHTGLVAAMLEISLFFYSQASFFPEVGDPSKETSPRLPAHSSLSLTVVELTRRADQSGIRAFGETITPRDGTRYLHAQLMTLMLLRFAWCHEFYHCMNGHVGLVRHLGIATALCQVGDAAHGASVEGATKTVVELTAQDVMQCLELDADRSALWASAKIQLAGDENVIGIERLDLRQRMKMVLFSSFLVTHFFAEVNRRAALPSAFHPSAELRLHNLMRTAASNIFDEYDEIRALFQEILREFACLENAVSGLMRTADLLRDFQSEEHQATLEFIEHKLSITRSATSAFNYVHCTAR